MSMLEESASFDPGEPLESFLGRIPATWCVYLLADAEDRPVQLLCVKNMRASLRRRLNEPGNSQSAEPSRRIDYRAVVRRLSWTCVDSAFEQDFVYLETARRAFPDTYKSVLGFAPAWWLHVDPAADRPHFSRTTEPASAPGRDFGPIPDKVAAQRLAHSVEDLFELCRDPAALAAAPGRPCQWRQMGKCVGPCNGDVSLRAYRALIAHVSDVLGDLDRATEEHRLRMRRAAAALKFEIAGQIKDFADNLNDLHQGAFRHLLPIEEFRFLAVMPARRRAAAKLFAITPGQILPLTCLCSPPEGDEDVLRMVLTSLATPLQEVNTSDQHECLSLVTHHLFASRKAAGVFIPARHVSQRTLAAAFVEVSRGTKKSQ